MDGQRIRQLQARGYAIAAAKAGLQHDHFRPSGTVNPLADANRIASLPVAWKPASPGDAFRGANLYGKAIWFGYWDLTQTQPGDYLVRQEDGGTWFVASQQHLLQPAGVECNAVVSVLRPAGPPAFDAAPTLRGGDIAGSEDAILTSWPASLLTAGSGEGSGVGLPGDVHQSAAQVLLPAAGIVITVADTVSDNLGRRWKVTSAEVTDLGWRLRVVYSGA